MKFISRTAIALMVVFLSDLSALSQIGSGAALSFDGQNDYVEIRDHSSLNARNSMTAEAWVFANSFGSNIYSNSILCKHNWASGNKGYVLRCGNRGNVSFIISGRSSGGTWEEANSTSSPMDLKKWYHVAGVFDGDSVKVYLNGVLQASHSYSGQIDVSSGANARIGQLSTGTGRNFDGMIDDVRLWDTALDSRTLKTWMCQKVDSGHKFFNRLQAHWSMDEQKGTTTKDVSNNSNAGSLNGPYWRGSGAPIGDKSVFTYGQKNLKLGTQFGDTARVYNYSGSPSYVHLFEIQGKSVYNMDPNVNAFVDSSHYFGVYVPEVSGVDVDLSIDYSKYSDITTQNECSVDLYRRYSGDSSYWTAFGAKLSINGDSIYASNRNFEEFALVYYPKDSSKFISTSSGKPWFCKGDSVRIIAGGNKEFTYEWYKDGVKISGASSRFIYASATGKYQVKAVRKGTSCKYVSSELSILERKLPTVSFSAISPVCESVDTVILKGEQPRGGYFYGPAVSDSFFFASAMGAGKYDLFYKYTDTALCSAVDTQTITVWSLPKLNLNRSIWTCDNIDSFPLNHFTPRGGNYSGIGIKSNSFFSDVVNDIAKFYAYSYTYTDTNGCANQYDDSLELRRSSTTILNSIPNLCLGNQPIKLVGLPRGGSFKGKGVSGEYFDPNTAGTGIHDVSYTYTNSVNCPSSVTKQARVFKGSTVSWKFNETVCVNSDSIALKDGSPQGGSFAGKGIRGSYFIPSLAGAGTQKLIYSFQDSNGCSSSADGIARVNDTTALSLTAPSPICPNIHSFTLNAFSPSGGTYSGQGMSNDSVFDPSLATIGTNHFSYEYTNSFQCKSQSNMEITLVELDSISISIKDKACLNEDPIRVTVYPGGGKLSGPGVISTFFSPKSAGEGTFTLKYEIVDGNKCIVIDSADILVGAIPTVSLTKYNSICDNEDVSFPIEGKPSGGRSFVNNEPRDSFISLTWTFGIQTVKYVFYNNAGCGDSIENNFWMNPTPDKPNITLDDSALVSSNYVNYQWLDENGPISGANERKYKPSDNGLFRVQVESDSGCVNISAPYNFDLIGVHVIESERIKIYPNPSRQTLNIISPNAIHAIQLLDANGRIVNKINHTKAIKSVDVSNLSSGSYMLRLEVSNGLVAFKRFGKY